MKETGEQGMPAPEMTQCSDAEQDVSSETLGLRNEPATAREANWNSAAGTFMPSSSSRAENAK